MNIVLMRQCPRATRQAGRVLAASWLKKLRLSAGNLVLGIGTLFYVSCISLSMRKIEPSLLVQCAVIGLLLYVALPIGLVVVSIGVVLITPWTIRQALGSKDSATRKWGWFILAGSLYIGYKIAESKGLI